MPRSVKDSFGASWKLPLGSFRPYNRLQCPNTKAAKRRTESEELQDGADDADEQPLTIGDSMSDGYITHGSDAMHGASITVSSTGEPNKPQTSVVEMAERVEVADADEFLPDFLDDEEERSDGSSTADDDQEMLDNITVGDDAVDAVDEPVPVNAVEPINASDVVGAVDPVDADAERAKKKAEHEVVETFARKHFSTLEKEMRNCLEEIIELGMVSRKKNKPIKMSRLLTAVKRCQTIQKASALKYANATEGRKKNTALRSATAKHPKTTKEIMACISGNEELKNPWSGSAESASELPEGGLLMRVTDEASKAKLYPDQGFLSGGFEADLATASGRREAMELHLNWSNRKPTAFISTTGCAIDFDTWRVPHMVKRDGKKPSRCTVKLTYINAYIRKAAGLPTLRVKEEMARYKVSTPGTRDQPWFKDEYILPFRVGPEQIVATHCWIAVSEYMRVHQCDYAAFHKAVVLPAFAEHEAARREGRPVNAKNSCVCWHCCDS
ncbi:hypothetical protein DL98DRAFT_596438 [Cadophora sp. DSE1049]|nr:hypothetical protein DL98DRAFT_596438 [Cadophora sp. DSE1049]